jgi:heptosyltransferase-2
VNILPGCFRLLAMLSTVTKEAVQLLLLLIIRAQDALPTRRLVSNLDGTILIVPPRGLGDYLMFTPALRKLRLAYPQANFVALSHSGVTKELDANVSIFNTHLTFPSSRSILQTCRVLLAILRQRPVMLLNAFPLESVWLSIVAIVGRTPYRGGIYLKSKSGRATTQTQVYNRTAQLTGHEVQRGINLVSAFIPHGKMDQSVLKPLIKLSDIEKSLAEYTLGAYNGNSSTVRIAVQPGSSEHQAWKRWPASNYAALVEAFIASGHMLPVIVGDLKERPLVDAILRGSKATSVIDLTGKASLRETLAIVAACDLVVCNDSSLLHIAAAFDIPAIAIYGPTDENRTKPNFSNVTVLRGNPPCAPCFEFPDSTLAENCPIDYSCLSSVSVEMVMLHVTRLINER